MRSGVLSGLFGFKAAWAIKALLDDLEDPDEGVALSAVGALQELKEDLDSASEVVRIARQSPTGSRREVVAEILAELQLRDESSPAS